VPFALLLGPVGLLLSALPPCCNRYARTKRR